MTTDVVFGEYPVQVDGEGDPIFSRNVGREYPCDLALQRKILVCRMAILQALVRVLRFAEIDSIATAVAILEGRELRLSAVAYMRELVKYEDLPKLVWPRNEKGDPLFLSFAEKGSDPEIVRQVRTQVWQALSCVELDHVQGWGTFRLNLDHVIGDLRLHEFSALLLP